MGDEPQEPLKITYLGADKVFNTVEEMLADIKASYQRLPWHTKMRWAITRNLHDFRWAILYRLHPKHRYHVVRTGLKPGYRDTVCLLPVVMIKMFKDFIEIEKPFEHFDTEDLHNKEHWDRIKTLYARVKDIDLSEMEDDSEEMTEILHSIVELRSHYWT